MANLTITFTPPGTVPANGYIVKYKKVGDPTYITVTPNPISSPIVINGVDLGVYEGTVQADCGGYTSVEVPFTAEGCPTITLEFYITEGSTSELANVEVLALNTSGPFTYLWSDGQTTEIAIDLIKGNTYSVTVTDGQGCSVTQDINPNVEILRGVSIEVMYFENNTTDIADPYIDSVTGNRLCVGGHSCNAAKYELVANGISQGVANMNNKGTIGGGNPDIDYDEYNSPPGSYQSSHANDRYFIKTITASEAASIAAADGTVTLELVFIGTWDYANLGYPNGHASAVWMRIRDSNGVQLSSTCISETASYIFDPYAA